MYQRAGLAVVERCPECGGRLRVQRRRSDRGRFIGCTSWPGCAFVEDFEERVQRLARRVADLEDEYDALEARHEKLLLDEALGSLARPEGGDRAAVAKELRELVAVAHPDRWPGSESLAHEVTARLNALRDRLVS